jgi:hypothetical protein
MTDPHAPLPPNRLKLATISLHIGAVIYALLGIGALALLPFLLSQTTDPTDRWVTVAMLLFLVVFSLGLAAASEAIVWGLGRRRTWAWVAGLCVFGLYVPSLFLPLGALGLWGLLDPGSRALFGMSAPGGAVPAGGTHPTTPKPGGATCLLWGLVAVFVLVVVIAVGGIVAAIVVPNFISARERAREHQGGASACLTCAPAGATVYATVSLPSTRGYPTTISARS